VPFFVGFFAKFSVLQAVVAAGYLWLAIAAVFFSLIGAFYYLRVVKIMYFDQPNQSVADPGAARHEGADVGQRPGRCRARHLPAGLMSLCAFALLRSL
jgi:NADH-quinone oxidoreductase subunit N